MRVVEDCLRFAVLDSHCTKVCKAFRHEFAAWVTSLENKVVDGQPISNSVNRLRMRDASGDIGRSEDVSSEYSRQGVDDLLKANFSRVKQSLRALEEFSKTICPDMAIPVERLRYKLYDLEKAVLLLVDSRDRLQTTRLYVLVDCCDQDLKRFAARVNLLCESGVDAIQLRDKSTTDLNLVRFAETLVEICSQHGVLSIVNDRVDICVAVGADGVHLGQDDMSIEQARMIAGPNTLIGISTHNLEQARQAALSGANYIGAGPTFPSSTKSFEDFPGLAFLQQVSAETTLPCFAIGGIDLSNLSKVIQAGVDRVAVSAAIPDDSHPDDQVTKRICALKSQLQHALQD